MRLFVAVEDDESIELPVGTVQVHLLFSIATQLATFL